MGHERLSCFNDDLNIFLAFYFPPTKKKKSYTEKLYKNIKARMKKNIYKERVFNKKL